MPPYLVCFYFSVLTQEDQFHDIPFLKLTTIINGSQVIYEWKYITKLPSLNLSILSFAFICPHNNKKGFAMELGLTPFYLLPVETFLIQLKRNTYFKHTLLLF